MIESVILVINLFIAAMYCTMTFCGIMIMRAANKNGNKWLWLAGLTFVSLGVFNIIILILGFIIKQQL